MVDFDIIVYGATGFTGRLVCEHLARNYPDGTGLRWAMAGRDAVKLAAVRALIGAPSDTPILVAEVDDPQALRALVGRTRLVIATAGPFVTLGEPIVAACSASGVDYVDLTGDAAWVRSMIDRYDDEARRSGARLLFSSGFDSIPSELGVWVLQKAALERFGMPARRVRTRVRRIQGGLSGGTIASARASAKIARADTAIPRLLADPFALVPGFSGPAQPVHAKPFFETDVGSWVAPFIMSGINCKTVHRSNALQGHAYGTDFEYDEMLILEGATDEASAARAVDDTCWSSGAVVQSSTLQAGEGPSKEERETGYYEMLFIGETADARQIRATLVGDRDPGYGSTSKIIAETALCLLGEAGEVLPGCWTAAAALGSHLKQRLTDRAGLCISVAPDI